MIELIFVIVVIGIVGKFGVEFLAQAYKNFIFTSVNQTLQSDSETAIEFISSRLQHRIKDSVIAKKSDASYDALSSVDPTATDYVTLEWIATDIDGFRGNSDTPTSLNFPNWSGIIDIDSSSKTTLVSPGSDTLKIDSLISTLSYGTKGLGDAALYFIGSDTNINSSFGWDGNITTQGEISSTSDVLHKIEANSATVAVDDFKSSIAGVDFEEVYIYEYYKLVWSANAVVYEPGSDNQGTLRFYYNYQPWNGDTYSDGDSAVLMENVSTFRFKAVGSIIKIQVCTKSNLISEETYSICKEKTIF